MEDNDEKSPRLKTPKITNEHEKKVTESINDPDEPN